MRLWTRLEEIERAGTVELEVAKDPGFNRVVERRRVIARPNRDFTVHARVSGLEPGERYFYRFDSGERELAGRASSARCRRADSRRPIRIGIFSCQDWEAGYYTAHAGLAAEDDLDLVVCLGDYIYERSFYERGRGPRATRSAPTATARCRRSPSTAHKYSLYHSDPNLRAIRATLPAARDLGRPRGRGQLRRRRCPARRRSTPGSSSSRRRRNGYRAYFEHMPFRPPPAASAEGRAAGTTGRCDWAETPS